MTMNTECVLRQNFQNGFQLVKFQYNFNVDGFFSSNSGKFNIYNTISDEFNLVWNVTYGNSGHRWTWEEICLEKCDRDISFNIMIQADSNQHILQDDFKVGSWPINHKLPSYKFRKITATFDIYYQDDKAFPKIEPAVFETYDKLLESKKSSDVVFVFGEDEEITAHTFILSARSDVFAAMFDSDMMEKNTGRVKIVDIEPTVFKQLLRFIYSGKIVSEDTDELLKLMVAANKYSVNDLVTICANRLSGRLSVDNAIEILIIADQINADGLKKDCKSAIVKNKKQIVGTPSFEKLRKFHKDLVFQIFDFFMGE